MIDHDLIRSKLIARRHQLGLSQRAVADTMGVNQSRISNLEKGIQSDVGIETINRWADALNIDISVTFGTAKKSPRGLW